MHKNYTNTNRKKHMTLKMMMIT